MPVEWCQIVLNKNIRAIAFGFAIKPFAANDSNMIFFVDLDPLNDHERSIFTRLDVVTCFKPALRFQQQVDEILYQSHNSSLFSN
jgi:hypothetical protein